MSRDRPKLPRELRRRVLMEAGYRCAIPTCKADHPDIDHIDDRAKGGADAFENLIALCPNCHDKKGRKEIDRKALRQYKANLSVVNHRYSEIERRIMQFFVDRPDQDAVRLPNGLEVLVLYLVRDGYLEPMAFQPHMVVDGFEWGPQDYRLTPAGREFIHDYLVGMPLDPPEDDKEG